MSQNKRRFISVDGAEVVMTVRRSVPEDIPQLLTLMNTSTRMVFGRFNITRVLEKANLSLNLVTEQGKILAHASLFDYPHKDIVNQSSWESYLQKHFFFEMCTPLNTLFLHVFMVEGTHANFSAKELMRAIYDEVMELEYICLVSPQRGNTDLLLSSMFKPMKRLGSSGPLGTARICTRMEIRPRLRFIPARIEDYDDIMQIYEGQSPPPMDMIELLQVEDPHSAFCEVEGAVVGFLSVASVDVKKLQKTFDLHEFDLLNKVEPDDPEATVEQSAAEAEDSTHAAPPSDPTDRELKTQKSKKPEKAEKTLKVFSIEYLILDQTCGMRSPDCMSYVFHQFPDVQYCVITVPLSFSFPFRAHLLQSFVHVPSSPTKLRDHDLYVLHKPRTSSVNVKLATVADFSGISRLIKDSKLRQPLIKELDLFYKNLTDASGLLLLAYVLHIDGLVVGVVIIRDDWDVEYIRAFYNIEAHINFVHHFFHEYAQIRHFFLKPAFQQYTKFFFREVLRLSQKSNLFYRVYPPPIGYEHFGYNCPDVVMRCAVPIRPRRQIIYSVKELGINRPTRLLTTEQDPYALGLITRKYTLSWKASVDAKIVVVGASDTALSFLEELTLCPHLCFNNLVLVSTNGFPGNYRDEEVAFLSTSYTYSSRYLAQIPLLCSISVVIGKMVRINCPCKYIKVSGGQTVPYDHLVLCTGLQYQVPQEILQVFHNPGSSTPTDTVRANLAMPPSPPWPVPSNLLTINDHRDCMTARSILQTGFLRRDDLAIVYGNSLDVYTSVETLLGLGLWGARIRLVLPPLEPGVARFPNKSIEETVHLGLRTAGIRVFRNFVLTELIDGESNNEITSATFTSPTSEKLVIQCGLFFHFFDEGIDIDTIRSIRKAGLAFDGRLLVDSNFRTRDLSIFGAGPLTTYAYRYRTSKSHKDYNAKELGQKMAEIFLSFLDPTKTDTEELAEGEEIAPLYKQPKIEGGLFPGGYYYLHVTEPPDPYIDEPDQSEIVLTTGNPKLGNYFSLHLGSNERVKTITCFSWIELPVSNLLVLFDKHQHLLGRLLIFHYEGLVPNLFSFFREKWSMAIFHEKFTDLERELWQIGSTIFKDVVLDQEDANYEEEEKKFGVVIRDKAVAYLQSNKNLLPMYYTPGQE